MKRSSLISWTLFLGVCLLVITPLSALFYGAFRSHSPGSQKGQFTIDNLVTVYSGLFDGGWSQSATLHSISLAIPVMFCACVVGVFLAWAIARTDIPGQKFFESAFLAPMLYSPLVGVIGWAVLADPRSGLINVFWTAMTGLADPVINIYSYFGIVWVMIFYFVPYAFVLNIGTFRSLDPSLEEAAAISGANFRRRMTLITLPIMLGSIASSALFIFILALEQFAIPGFLGSHIQFDTLAYKIYRMTNAYPVNLPAAAASGTLLLLLSAIGLYYYRMLTRHSERFITITARGYKPARMHLGLMRWPLAATMFVIFLVGIALPLSAVMLRALMPVRTTGLELKSLNFDNFYSLFQAQDILLSLQNSLFLAATTATICALFGLVLGYRIVRLKSMPMTLADYLISMPIGIPGTVFGIGMLWAYVSSPIYLTIWIILLAFITRYLVYGVRTLSSGLMQIDKALEEAATVAGASPFKSFMFVNLPLLKPVITSVWLLVFMIVMREISATVILSSVDSLTMPLLTWSYLLDGFYGVASALAILQLLIVASIVALFKWAFGSDLHSKTVD